MQKVPTQVCKQCQKEMFVHFFYRDNQSGLFCKICRKCSQENKRNHPSENEILSRNSSQPIRYKPWDKERRKITQKGPTYGYSADGSTYIF